MPEWTGAGCAEPYREKGGEERGETGTAACCGY